MPNRGGQRTIVRVSGALNTLASWRKIQSRLILLLFMLLITEMLEGAAGKSKS